MKHVHRYLFGIALRWGACHLRGHDPYAKPDAALVARDAGVQP